jgi:Uma2 family endonuclease
MPIPVRKGDERFTYADYMKWPETERWELLEGVPVNMTPAPSRYHQEILLNLATEINRILKEKGQACKVYAAPFDVRLPETEEADEEITTVVQPDISVICDVNKLDEWGCRGAPDLVVEIVSPATVKKDMIDKLTLYEKHGVLEYWIIHPGERSVMVYKLDKEKRYGRADVLSENDKINLHLKDTFEIALKDIF